MEKDEGFIELFGIIKRVSLSQELIYFEIGNKRTPFGIDLFTGITFYRKLNKVQRENMLKIIRIKRGRVTVKGHCYNSQTVVAESIRFDDDLKNEIDIWRANEN